MLTLLLWVTFSSISLRFISLMRHSPHQKNIIYNVLYASIQTVIYDVFLRDSLLTHKKSTTPGNLMSKTVPASAPPGMRLSCGQLCPWQKHRPKWQLRPRTRHTLKALGHFISVYYALFCVIKMPAIPLFIGHCGQYKTLWYFIIKCKKFKCLWEGF